jgi:hypothetical protein
LPWIDQVIDSTAGCDLLCFLDCYSGYHQIAIKEEDQEKTSFITPFGAYCYTTMSFGLKNAGATYQRAIQACFKRQLNKNRGLFAHKGAQTSAIIKFLSVLTKNTGSNCNQLVEPVKDWKSDCLAKRILVRVELCGVLGRLHSIEGLAQFKQ